MREKKKKKERADSLGENSIKQQQWLKVIIRAIIRSSGSVEKEIVKFFDSVQGQQVHRSCGADFPSCPQQTLLINHCILSIQSRHLSGKAE